MITTTSRRLSSVVMAFFLSGPVAAQDSTKLNASLFADPPREYRPVDCWWWDGGALTREKLRWQIEDLHAKGVGGTWLYPRYGARQPMSGDPGFWTDGWWDLVDYSLKEHERLGMTQWSNDWLGRLDKSYFQSLLRAERAQRPELTGRRLVALKVVSTKAQTLKVTAAAGETILTAAAFKRKSADAVDSESRIDLMATVKNNELSWDAPEAGWLLIAVVSQPHDLDYLGPAVSKRWIELYFEEYRRRLGTHLGKSLAAYGPDERHVLNGNILYSDALKARIPVADLPALFLDIGPRTDAIRCGYYAAMAALLEENLYEPIHRWLRDRGMKQATVATWGRQDILGQTSNYGDFFRMMKHFEIPGNEDSAESNPGAFLDAKLSSSIAHVHGNPRVAVCAYWGLGWGFTQSENIARTNANFAYGITLYNSHGVMYSLMGSRNEFVPPSIHFYQPYWQTWKTFTDFTSRLSYVLSQGHHRADVAILYPLSTLHANWHDGSKFDKPASDSQKSFFALANAVHAHGLDFDFLDEASIAAAKIEDGKLKPGPIEFPVVLLPAMTTLRADVLAKLETFVAAGGTLVAMGDLPTASAERGRDDPAMIDAWRRIMEKGGQRFVSIRGREADAAKSIVEAITPDFVCPVPEVIQTHQRVGADHVYFIVNRQAKRRTIEASVRAAGVPEIWDARTGAIRRLHQFEIVQDRTKLQLDLDPYAGVLIVIKPDDQRPRVVAENIVIEDVRKNGDGYDIVGTSRNIQELSAKVVVDGRTLRGHLTAPKVLPPISLDGLWECEYRRTMHNKWGDFRYPARDEWIGPEAPVMKYREEPSSRPDWHLARLDDRDWKDVKCTYGPYWRVLGPLDPEHAPAGFEQALQQSGWREYSYSHRFGADRVDIHQQTYEGMTAVAPEFLVFDRPAGKAGVWFLTTRVYSPKEQKKHLAFGRVEDRLPRQAWVNGKPACDEKTAMTEVLLKRDWNEVALRIAAPAATARKGKVPPVATYAVFQPDASPIVRPRFMPLSPWTELSPELIHDCRQAKSVGWYRFHAPPGAITATLPIDAESVEAWVDGQPVRVTEGKLTFPSPGRSNQVTLRIVQKPGSYEGAAFRAPVSFECGRGRILPGDWCHHGLAHYSGGLRYITTVKLAPEQLTQRVTLDLGDVRVSAEVTVNGKTLGVRLAAPFEFDITSSLQPGENAIQVEVLNTLANFMNPQPTRYVFPGQTASGLLGPVQLRFAVPVTIPCRK